MEASVSSSNQTQREQRILAVAKLKRAASLPRMKDGRRPPMHPEGFSEGERVSPAEEPDTPTPPSGPEDLIEPTSEPPQPTPPSPPPAQDVEIPVEIVNDGEIEADAELDEQAVTPTITKKRRSRSRSRSRGSRDFKGKARAAQSPTPILSPGDSSQDEEMYRQLPPVTIPISFPPRFMSPSPLQQSRFMRSPTPDAGMTMLPYPSSPPTPLPSLEALTKNLGLFRSNSAGRMMAMHKLTGGTETYEPSPSPTPPTAKFRRNNTVSGGERNAARKLMLDKLAGRSTPGPKESEWEQSGPEETFTPPAPTPSPTPKRKRRRSRRTSSTAANAPSATTDSELPSTSPNTPLVPPTPLPIANDLAAEFRARSATPSHVPIQSSPEPPRNIPSHPASPDSGLEHERRRRRSVVVEEEEDDQYQQHPLPSSSPSQALRPPHSSDAPTVLPTQSGSPGLPLSIKVRTSEHDEEFPNSPFATPMKEKVLQDEEEEEVLYPGSSYEDNGDSRFEDREISWVADQVPVIRMPIDEDGDGAEEDEMGYASSPRSSSGFSPQDGYDRTSARDSSDSQNMVVEVETSPEFTPSHVPPSPSSFVAVAHTASFTAGSDDSQTFPTRLSVASRSPLNAEFIDVEDRSLVNDTSSKRTGDSASTSTWERMRNAFGGRRSRNNSFANRDRRDHTDSSVSRESGASLSNAGRAENSAFAIQQSQSPVMQSHSASASYVSLTPNTPGSRGGVSPVPPPSSADLAIYQNMPEKLFPFPGMIGELRRKGLYNGSASTPDINMLASLHADDVPIHNGASGSQSPPSGKDRRLSRQLSDTGLKDRYALISPQLTASASFSSKTDYFSPTPVSPPNNTPGSTSKLPTTIGGVRQWLGMNKKSSGQSTPSPSAATPASLPVQEDRQTASKKLSLSDLLRIRKEADLGTDWEELGSTPTSASGSTLVGKHISGPLGIKDSSRDLAPVSDTERTPKAKRTIPMPATSPPPTFPSARPDLPSPPDPSSTTPDPSSSLSDYPASASSSTTTSSHYSYIDQAGAQGSFVLERLDENLGRSSRSPMWASLVEDAPRKLLIASPVLQIVNPNTVKDRFLFLFSDLLIIAKPVTVVLDNEDDTMTKGLKQDNRKFIVKSTVHLRDLRCSVDRSDSPAKSSNYGPPRSPLIRTFVHQFSKDPDQAISTLFTKSGLSDDPVLLGKLLFRTTDLDRAQLGDYLSRRTSKLVLKSYLSSFGFVGLRVDRALRAFLLSVHVPSQPFSSYSALDYLLDAFAARWYEANAAIVTYDRNLTIRLVRLLFQLNQKLHGEISSEPGRVGYGRQEMKKEFITFFRSWDSRHAVPDELLEDLYLSIALEGLYQARVTDRAHPDVVITIKRPLPLRLTYKIQSEPIVLRIPQADPHLSIQLYGQDLTFDPPVLSFQKSSEASFRVMGTSLGTKTMMMCRSGPNALKYSGLPFSNIISIERAFMRNTFQVAFLNHERIKRRYMFSVDDPLIRNEWAASLKRQIDSAVSSVSSPGSSKFFRAVDFMAFKALQETLIGSGVTTLDPVDRALQGFSSQRRAADNGNGVTNGTGIPPAHSRSKSRSQLYHRSGAARNELDLNGAHGHTTSISGSIRSAVDFPMSRPDAPQWTRRELELQCLQNSSISLVLSLLQIGAPDHGQQIPS